jgi:hypothetical protein
MASLWHPNIAQLFEAGTHGGEAGIHYFVMEYIPKAKNITGRLAFDHANIVRCAVEQMRSVGGPGRGRPDNPAPGKNDKTTNK